MNKWISSAAGIFAGAILLSGCSQKTASVPEFVFPESSDADDVSLHVSLEADTETEEPYKSAEDAPADEPVYVVTSHDPLHYIEMTFDGFTITARGRYDGTVLRGVSLCGTEAAPVYEGDCFTAEITAPNPGAGYVSIVFEFDRHKEDFRLCVTESGCRLADASENAADNSAAADMMVPLPSEGVAEYICPDKNPEHIAAVLAQVREISDLVCDGQESDYDRLRALAAWVSENIYYDFDARDSSVTSQTLSIENVLETHRTVCGGFSTLFSALCQAQGIECYNIRGTAINTGMCYAEVYGTDAMHEWNYAVIDGRRVWVDTVWNTFNSYIDGSYNSGTVYYQYFDPAENVLALDHSAARCEWRDYFALEQGQ